MHAWIYQISDAPIKEAINEDTLYQGDGTDYDYCAAITEEGRKSAIEALKAIFCCRECFDRLTTQPLSIKVTSTSGRLNG